MDCKDVVLKRRTIRDFSPESLKISEIRDAVYDAFQAPTYDHL